MPSYPLYDEPMSSAERSRRNLFKKRKMMAEVRNLCLETIEFLMAQGHHLVSLGEKDRAQANFRHAELFSNQVLILNKELEPHEKSLLAELPEQRKNHPSIDPHKAPSILSAAAKQAAYEASREDRRPAIKARYGPLAKAEKAETVE